MPDFENSSKPKLLDAYCGAGGAARGYQRAGFYVVGVDIAAQPHYIGDEFHRGDAIEFIREHGHEFDVIHASPPCQAYSSQSNCWPGNEYPDLIAVTREAILATGKPWKTSQGTPPFRGEGNAGSPKG